MDTIVGTDYRVIFGNIDGVLHGMEIEYTHLMQSIYSLLGSTLFLNRAFLRVRRNLHVQDVDRHVRMA